MGRYHTVEAVASFADLEEEFVARVRRMVWCNVATVDARGRPRSRVLHPIWEGTTGWILCWHNSPKVRDIARNPHVSLAYVTDITKPVYADCVAELVGDAAEKARVWELVRATLPPVGYDPAEFWVSHDHPDFGLLKLTPWRIEVTDFPRGSRAWRPAPG